MKAKIANAMILEHIRALLDARDTARQIDRNVARQQIRKRSACLERARMLTKLQLGNEHAIFQAKIRARGLENWRPPDVRPNQSFDTFNTFGRDLGRG
jgi:hypothetical protein